MLQLHLRGEKCLSGKGVWAEHHLWVGCEGGVGLGKHPVAASSDPGRAEIVSEIISGLLLIPERG